jgi:acetyl esterase/lipase
MWISALITGELALHQIAWQAVATALFIWAGALDAWPGWIGLGLTAASWVGLIVLFARAYQASSVLDAALHEAVGGVERNGFRPKLGELVVAKPRLPAGVEVLSDVSYGSHPLQILNIYRPVGLSSGAPVVVQIHGGSWMRGRKERQARPLMHHLAQQGWVGVAIGYRLSPGATFPDHVIDAKAAVAWVRRHIAEYGGDPGFVAVTGGSSGGHLASLVAFTPNDAGYQPGFEDEDTSVQAFVGFYGVYSLTNADGTRGRWPFIERYVMKASPADDPDGYRTGSPLNRVNGKAPPTLAIHGTHDSLVPVGDSERLIAALSEAGAGSVALAAIPGATHGFDYFYSVRSAYTADAVARFLDRVLVEHHADEATP